MTETINPWGPPGERVAPQLAACPAICLALMKTLREIARADEELLTVAAVTAVGDLLGSLISSSGLLWTKPDLIEAVRALADDLEARREAEQPVEPVQARLVEFFAAGRPPQAN